jgi:hypothetical protein
VVDLEAAGTSVIQVDEPALRETLPLRAADRPVYLAWATEAFRLTTAGIRPDTQIHTHMCYRPAACCLRVAAGPGGESARTPRCPEPQHGRFPASLLASKGLPPTVVEVKFSASGLREGHCSIVPGR